MHIGKGKKGDAVLKILFRVRYFIVYSEHTFRNLFLVIVAYLVKSLKSFFYLIMMTRFSNSERINLNM